jgi:uncharacterized membrane protein
MHKQLKIHPIGLAIAISGLVFLICSSIRHLLFQSTAWDLAIFDQGIFLISQDRTPISSLMGFHILADHAALILYPLAVLYKIYPSVYWLFVVQAFSLALGALSTWYLARGAGLKEAQATTMGIVYLLYPLIFNVNLFDFHPEAIAIPGLLAAILAARLGSWVWFCGSLILVLSCKAALALTVAAMGVWLLCFEKRRLYGAIAIFSGIAWFIVATGFIIPFFGGEIATIGRHLSRYQHLGSSFTEVINTVISQPGLFLSSLFNLRNLEYIGLLIAPLLWGLSFQHLTPLVGAIPTLVMNLLADESAQKNLVHHYSVAIVPFLIIAVISSLAAGKGWVRNQRGIIIWSLVAFLALAKYGYFGSLYLNSLDTWQASRSAIAQIKTNGSVLTTHNLAPHLSHRSLIKFTNTDSPPTNLTDFEYILLNLRHPGWKCDRKCAQNILNQLQTNPQFQLKFNQDEVYLFRRN